MSRIGKQPIEIPSGVDVTIGEDALVTVKGPRGELRQRLHPEMRIVRDEGVIRVERPSDEGFHRSLHGLTRSLIANMVEGVTKGFEKRLEIQGVGYRAALRGQALELSVGFSHPVVVEPRAGITFEVPTPTEVIVKGIDKQQVGQTAAEVRSVRPPEPYKGKGIRYQGEYVRRKVGKRA
jgi:large subunit ribosomal protein L6